MSRWMAGSGLVLVGLVFAAPPPLAQAPSSGGPRSGTVPLEEVALWSAPPVDVERLLAEDEAGRDRPGIPLRIGLPMATDLSPSNAGTWEDLTPGGRLWRLKVRTDDALWTVLGFDRFELQPGGELLVYDPDRTTVLGPYTAADVREHRELWFPPIAGDTLVVELYWPERLRDVEPALHLGTVSHGYKRFGNIGAPSRPATRPADAGGETEFDPFALDDSGSCNIDVNCPLGAAWQDHKRGVVILLSGGSGFCTGSMINTTADDCRPYVLTANHCSAGPSTTFGFNFEKPDCASGTPPPATNQTVTGSTVRASFSDSDFTLLELDLAPPEAFDVYYNGWSRDPQPASESFCIHHPSGDVKKISHNFDPLVDGQNWGPDHWRVTEWEEGTTEPGSSGSPMFDQNQRVVGQLHGGTASCSSITYDEYGKLDVSWTGGGSPTSRLQDWLDPEANGALVMDGVDWSTCAIQLAGSVSLDRSLYACSDTLLISLRDDHLEGAAGQDVTVRSDTESTPETVTLSAAPPGSGTFVGSIAAAPVPATGGDGVLSVLHGETITVEYLDADDGEGGMNVPRQSTALVDCNAPIIGNVQSGDVTGSSATVTWDTDEPSDSLVTHGLTPPGSLQTIDAALVTSHSVRLQGLNECSEYYFSVTSADAVGNAASDDNLGAYYLFETGRDVEPEFQSTDTPVSIPDNDPTGATSTIQVDDIRTVLDVDVRVEITHTYDGDLTLSLLPPAGPAVILADRRGGGGNDYIGTVFDDEAATPISTGSPPFTGTFRPDQPLSGADGIAATGDWRLSVVDQAGADVGSIEAWSLELTYPAEVCGPHAGYASHGLDSDTCSSGGVGSGNGFWEPGEEVRFRVEVSNDGSDPLTGITVQVVASTAGVVMLDDTAQVADLAPGETGATQAPHLTVRLPSGLTCGATLDFQVDVQAQQGAWSGGFDQGVGEVVQGGGVVLDEDFESGTIPAGWTVLDGLDDGNTWYADDATDPLGCGNTDPGSPIAGTWAAVDSDCTGSGVSMDEELISPVLDLGGALTVALELDHWFRRYEAELAEIDVRSTLTGGEWVNVARWTGASTTNPQHEVLNLTAQAAGAADVEIRWHYHNADFEWTWFVDNVRVSYTAPSGCNLQPCTTSSTSPPPVPDGSGASQPMLADRGFADGSRILVQWDDQCAPAGTNLLYGPLSQVSTWSVAGAVCSLANPGIWDPAPAGDLWFLLVGDDGAGVESSWGQASSGERNGPAASGQCAVVVKDVSGSCP